MKRMALPAAVQAEVPCCVHTQSAAATEGIRCQELGECTVGGKDTTLYGSAHHDVVEEAMHQQPD
jgi:hypothetical protein